MPQEKRAGTPVAIDTSRRRVRVRGALYAFAALNDFVPLVPVAALRFADAGLNTTQVTSLFGLLALAALVLEVPSGAWADIASRRMLLAVGALARAGCFALWVVAPSYPAFIVGVVLWGACHALTSGTLEALVYDHLKRAGASAEYPRMLGRSRIGALAANALATLLAAPLLALGHYTLVEAASALLCLATAGVALRFPKAGRVQGASSGGDRAQRRLAAYADMLRVGLAEIRGSRVVRRAALVAAVLPAVLVIDEYLPLLVRSSGAATATVPLLVVVAVAFKAVGGWLAGPLTRIRPTALAVGVAAAAAMLAGGSLSRHPLSIVPVSLCLGVVQLAIVLAQARLQDAVESAARATVTSVAGLGTDAVAIAFYVAYGVGALWADVPTVIAAFAAVPFLLALLIPRWLPRHGTRAPDGGRGVGLAGGRLTDRPTDRSAAPGTS